MQLREFTTFASVKLVHPFNLHEFLESMLAQGSVWSSNSAGSGGYYDSIKSARARLGQLLRKKRYLVILEDVSTIEQWNSITTCLPNNSHHSRVVVSTKQMKIATLCTGEPTQVLELSDGLSIFAINLCHTFNNTRYLYG